MLGSFTLEAGTGNSVILNADLADGLAVADAVRITRAVNLGDTAYLHTDHLGTPQKMTDASGSVVWDRVARPFGATHSESGSLATDLRFPGQLHDAESGLYYNYFRDYDPTLGRYIQSDPIGLEGGLNTYGYAYQNSVRYIDPTGEVPLAVLCLANPALCGAVIGGTVGLLIDYLQERCTCDGNEDIDALSYSAIGAGIGFTGPFVQKPRTGVSGGGKSGNKTSMLSEYLYKSGQRKNPLGQALKTAGRRMSSVLPGLGAVLLLYDIYTLRECAGGIFDD